MRKPWFLTSMGLRDSTTYRTKAPGKINLGLRVLRRRSDGFHDLETVFYPLRWADTLTVRKGASLTLTCTNPALGCGDSNLVIRAARLLAGDAPAAASMALDKRLPLGAGLGGGSSDAAAALRLLPRLWGLSVSEVTIRHHALSLGSDVPYFLNPVPAYATGRGELLTPMPRFTLPGALVVVVPAVHVSTAWAFARITPAERRAADLRHITGTKDLATWRSALVNDFERTVFEAHPGLYQRKSELLAMGAAYASLSGTGSAVFGVFEDWAAARRAANAALEAGCTVHAEPAP